MEFHRLFSIHLALKIRLIGFSFSNFEEIEIFFFFSFFFYQQFLNIIIIYSLIEGKEMLIILTGSLSKNFKSKKENI